MHIWERDRLPFGAAFCSALDVVAGRGACRSRGRWRHRERAWRGFSTRDAPCWPISHRRQ